MSAWTFQETFRSLFGKFGKAFGHGCKLTIAGKLASMFFIVAMSAVAGAARVKRFQGIWFRRANARVDRRSTP